MAKKSKKKLRKKSKYVTGGTMYENNIPGTVNLVAQESDPTVLREAEKTKEEETQNLIRTAQTASEQIEQDAIRATENIEMQAALDEQQRKAIETTAKTIGDKFVKPKNRVNPLSDAVGAYRGVRAANLASKAQEGVTAGVQTAKQAAQGAKAVQLASQTSKLPVGVAAPQTVSTLAEGAKGASAIGAGLKNFATSGAGIGTIATIGGQLISRASDDKDATTLKFGEGAGKVLSGVGTGLGAAALTGMALGSAVPLVGNIIGAGLGAAYGLVSGLVSRNKARRQQRQAQREEDRYARQTNKRTGLRFGSQMSNVRAQQLRAKTFSGYDQGINTTAKMGGLKLGMPRY